MYPLLISGIASVASKAIDAWQNVATQNAALKSMPVQQARFDNAFGKAMSVNPATGQSANPVQSLESQLRNAPEISSILNSQDPSKPAALSVSADGRVFMQVPGNQPTELSVSQDTQNLARQLSSAVHNSNSVSAAYNRGMSTGVPASASLVTLR
jgi:hypothetical protein